MKKFKYVFSVFSDNESLLTAFADELRKIGHTFCEEYAKPTAESHWLLVDHFGTYDKYECGFNKHADKGTKYYLPREWDEALAAAKETVEVPKEVAYYLLLKDKPVIIEFGEGATQQGFSEIIITKEDMTSFIDWIKKGIIWRQFNIHALFPDNIVRIGCTKDKISWELNINI